MRNTWIYFVATIVINRQNCNFSLIMKPWRPSGTSDLTYTNLHAKYKRICQRRRTRCTHDKPNSNRNCERKSFFFYFPKDKERLLSIKPFNLWKLKALCIILDTTVKYGYQTWAILRVNLWNGLLTILRCQTTKCFKTEFLVGCATSLQLFHVYLYILNHVLNHCFM
jgi:hypothetical protein